MFTDWLIMNDLIFSVIVPLLVFIMPTFLFWLSVSYQPVWVAGGPLEDNWGRINKFSFVFSWLAAVLAYFIYNSFDTLSVMNNVVFDDNYFDYLKWFVVISAALLGFCLIQTFFSDFSQRYASKNVLFSCNVILFILGLLFYSHYAEKNYVILYVMFFLFATIVIYLPGIGASDGRAMQLVVATSIPITGFIGFQYGLVLFLLVLFVYGVGRAIVKKSFKELFGKVSLPLVPLIILPFFVLIMFYPLFV